MENPLLSSLFDEEESRPATVSEVSADIKAVLERGFASVWVEGEITNFHSAASGHWYFSLTDGDAVLRAACFKGQNFKIRFKPSNGLQVRCRGRITLYEKRGEYQLMVESLEPVGEGALTIAFEQIKAKLLKEGLFDEALKRTIPSFPRSVGVVTSPTGAAVHDIMTVLDRRARSVNIVLVPTLVQGEKAGEQIAAAIKLANEFNSSADTSSKIDVLIVGRGGGSAEDLSAFNEEVVARAIRASAIPVISAVGHEVDFTIADFVADLRAPTPSAAAEIVAKAEADIGEHLRRSTAELVRSIGMQIMANKADLQSLAMAPVFAEFPSRIRELRHRVDQLSLNAHREAIAKTREYKDRLSDVTSRLSPIGLSAKVSANTRRLALLEQRSKTAASELTVSRHRALDRSMAKLDALSPLSVLTRGYSITQKADGEIIRNAHQTKKGERLNIRLANGKLETEVTEVCQE
ncbi:MAG: exodeoxyribonuclease VII large subunit [Pyrinomonadaceae bacterium]